MKYCIQKLATKEGMISQCNCTAANYERKKYDYKIKETVMTLVDNDSLGSDSNLLIVIFKNKTKT